MPPSFAHTIMINLLKTSLLWILNLPKSNAASLGQATRTQSHILYLPKVCMVQPIWQYCFCLIYLLLYWHNHWHTLYLSYYNSNSTVSWLSPCLSIICIVTLQAQQSFSSSEQLGILAREPWVWLCLLLMFHHRRKEWGGPLNLDPKIWATYATFCFETITNHIKL